MPVRRRHLIEELSASSSMRRVASPAVQPSGGHLVQPGAGTDREAAGSSRLPY